VSRIFQALKKAEAMAPAVRESEPAPPRAPGVAPVAVPPLSAPMVRPLGSSALEASIPAAVRAALPDQVLREMTSLRVNIESMFPDRKPITVAVTGPQGREGASTVAAQFAIALAGDPQLRTLLVDASAQRPALLVAPGPLAGLFEPGGGAGPEGALDLLPVPEVLRNAGIYSPAELEAALRSVRAHYDWIVIDLPSVLYSADSASLSAVADGVMMVVEAGRTKKPVLGRAVDLLRKAGARVIGSVLNRRQLEIPEFIYRRI
jgi:Mrp family chromosome partitioning ATPase